MPCGVCRQEGHNRRTCRLLDRTPVISATGTSTVSACKLKNEVQRSRDGADFGVGVHSNDGLRASLPPEFEVWNFRNHLDAYTRRKQSQLTTRQIDHVFEIQLLDAAYNRYLTGNLGHRTTRAEKERIIHIANGIANANVTSRDVNLSKRGPFTKAKNAFEKSFYDADRCPGVDSYFYASPGTKLRYVYPGMSAAIWENVKKEVVLSYDNILDSIPNAIYDEDNSVIFCDLLQDLYASLKLE
jgi:hypothetical protein